MKIKRLTKKNYGGIRYKTIGSAVHSGFGLGFERLVLFVTGMTNIRDVIPFQNTIEPEF
jgi:aspartyl/asparaginyl-tRNA synthetase